MRVIVTANVFICSGDKGTFNCDKAVYIETGGLDIISVLNGQRIRHLFNNARRAKSAWEGDMPGRIFWISEHPAFSLDLDSRI